MRVPYIRIIFTGDSLAFGRAYSGALGAAGVMIGGLVIGSVISIPLWIGVCLMAAGIVFLYDAAKLPRRRAAI